MSYINDALHKVQKEKESPYASYGHVLAAQSEKRGPGRKLAFAAVMVIILFFAAGFAVWFYWPDNPQTPREISSAQHPGDAALKVVPKPPPVTAGQSPVDPAAASESVVPSPAAGERSLAQREAPDLKVKEKSRKVSIPEPKPPKEALPQAAPADVGKLYAQALQAQREGHLEEAKELYKKVIQKEPRHLQALNNLGVVYLKMKRYKWAVRRFNDALTVKPDYADAHYNLACLYAQKNDTKQSIFYLKNAVDSNPEVRQWASRDEDLKNLAGLPEFGNIIKERDQ